MRKIFSINREQGTGNNGEIVDPQFYYCLPDVGVLENIPFLLVLKPPYSLSRNKVTYRVHYCAGYRANNAPPDLASACLELAAWNMNRYKGRRIGMTGNVRSNGRDGEHFELSMPENVKALLEPYRRKVI